MPTFDIVNKIDMQEVDNAVNMTKKMIATRYDFRKSRSQLTFDKRDKKIQVVTEDSMKMKAIDAELSTSFSKRRVDPKAMDPGEIQPAAGDMLKRDIRIIDGIEADSARQIVKLIKGMKLKVQAKIMEGQVRVSGKKIDDLQAVIGMLKAKDLGLPLQFINLKS